MRETSLAGFAISEQFDFRNSAERFKEFSQCAFCHAKRNISDVKLHDVSEFNRLSAIEPLPSIGFSNHHGKSRGFGFITMDNVSEGNAAISGLHGKDKSGRKLTVNEARPKDDGGGRPFPGSRH